MTPIEIKIRELLDLDFKEWLGKYRVEVRSESMEYGIKERLGVFLFCADGRKFKAEAGPYHGAPEELYAGYNRTVAEREVIMLLWKAVASAWLDDPEADRGEPHVLGTNQKNPWTRSDRPLPSKLSDKELDIRHRLAFGWKVDRGRHEDVKLPTKMHLEQVDSSMLDAWKGK